MEEIKQQAATRAVSQALSQTDDPRTRSDLLFIEAWEIGRLGNLGATLRASQIRRANPDLVAAIELELKAGQHAEKRAP